MILAASVWGEKMAQIIGIAFWVAILILIAVFTERRMYRARFILGWVLVAFQVMAVLGNKGVPDFTYIDPSYGAYGLFKTGLILTSYIGYFLYGIVGTLLVVFSWFKLSPNVPKNRDCSDQSASTKEFPKNINEPEIPSAATDAPQASSITSRPESTPQINEKMIQKKKKRFCKHCGGEIDAETRKCAGCGKQYFKPAKKDVKVFLIALCAFMLASIAANMVLFADLKETKQELHSVTKSRDDYRNKYNESLDKQIGLQEKNNDIAYLLSVYKDNLYWFIPGSWTCHTFDCSQLSGYKSDELNIIIWSDAQYEGYGSCPYCKPF